MKPTSLFSVLLLPTVSLVTGYWTYCKPYKWKAGEDFDSLEGTTIPIREGIELAPRRLLPGEVNCRYWTSNLKGPDGRVLPKRQEDYPDGLTLCERIVARYSSDLGSVADFVRLNPGLEGDCSNFDLNREWCVSGFLEPLRAYNGKCGPPNNGATCIGTDHQCCNSETWTCGDKEDGSCDPGTCYEGTCYGHTVFSLDGNCGSQHDGLICGGKWGNCCSKDGKCGDGFEFCAAEKCQSGLCWKTDTPEDKTQRDFDRFLEEHLGYAGGTTTDGTCGGRRGLTCGDYTWGRCCGKNGRCGHGRAACGEGCQPEFGKCQSTHNFIRYT